ncbi:TetR/AcrR family transcriptional regulator [Sphingobacterium lactis]|uniref:TetR/AcrR family transcriptional regulator n=1 Tax=Sphingobacterium lactis TaxID=797291 RepID=UPI003EC6997C
MENRKDQIIEAALKRFAHFGFHKTTMNEIADDLRITKANLYYYYPDKSTLILDVVCKIATDLQADEKKVIDQYANNFMETMFKLIELRGDFTRKYYIFHINENLDWIKGIDIYEVMEDFYQRDVALLKCLYEKAMIHEGLVLDNVDEVARAMVEIQKGVSFIHTISDMITGIPNDAYVDKIIESQKRAVKLIFEARLAK